MDRLSQDRVSHVPETEPMDTSNRTVVDATGRHCPVPVIELARAVEQTPVDGLVEVLSDDPSSRVDIPVWCRMKRHELLEVRDVANAKAYLVRRAG